MTCQVNFHLYHYAGNNPVKYVDPTGMWIDNEDGTFTAEKGDTLWELYGEDWKQYSNYEGDPKSLQIGEIVGEKTDSEYPLAPSDVDIQKNINEAKDMTLYEFYNAVKNNGKRDYKQKGVAYEKFGNFNFGVVGKAKGFPSFILKRGAGWAQEKAGTSKNEWNSWFSSYPYGDDPRDQEQINLGIQFYEKQKKN